MLDGRRDQVPATFRDGNIAVVREPRYICPQVVQHDPGTALGEKFDVCSPQPAACPSHNRDLPLQRNSLSHLAILLGSNNLSTRAASDVRDAGAISVRLFSRERSPAYCSSAKTFRMAP